MAITCEQGNLDEVLAKLETRLAKVDQVQGSRVKLPKAEVELLEQIQVARDFMSAILADRQKLQDVFGDGSQLARMRALLEAIRFSGQNAEDKRVPSCFQVLETVEKLLLEKGTTEVDLQKQIHAAVEKEKAALSIRRSSIRLHEVGEAVRVRMRLEAMLNVRRKRRDLIPKIIAADSLESLAELEPIQREQLGPWMIWMVHRVHLNDPTLDTLDFTNLQMPPPIQEAAADSRAALLAPKLVKAIAKNTYIKKLYLANSNLQGAEGRELGSALALNKTLRRLTIDSNMLNVADLEVVLNGLAKNRGLQEFRCNNQLLGESMGRSRNAALEALLCAVQTNTHLVKIGLHIEEPHFNNEINRQIMQNNAAAKTGRRVTAEDLDEETVAEAARRAAQAIELGEQGDDSSESDETTSSDDDSDEFDGRQERPNQLDGNAPRADADTMTLAEDPTGRLNASDRNAPNTERDTVRLSDVGLQLDVGADAHLSTKLATALNAALASGELAKAVASLWYSDYDTLCASGDLAKAASK